MAKVLPGLCSPFFSIARRGGFNPYKVKGFRPDLVFDFDGEYYRTSGSTSAFSSAITHTRAGNATMVDSDGVLKWAPHNLVLNSASPATQSITVISGADYTVECTGVSVALSGAGTGTATEGNPVTITASTTTLTLTVTGSSGTMRAYRSDLGGMVDNPDRGDSYVPTTSSAVYLPRRGHHVYNGTEWVNEGLLHESEARTNLVEYSNDFTDASWAFGAQTGFMDAVENSAISPSGENDAWKLVPNSTTEDPTTAYKLTYPFAAAAPYASSVYAKAGEYDYLITTAGPYVSGFWAAFNLANGTVHSQPTDPETTAYIEDAGNGWYRCWLVCTDNAGSEVAHVTPSVDGTLTTKYVDTTSGIYVYGAQFEEGSTPSSYIPTSGSTVTRAPETLTVPAANLPYDSTNMSIQMDGLVTFADEGSATQETLFDWRVDSNNRITLNLDTDSAKVGTLTLTMVNGSGTDETISTTAELTPGVSDPFNVAIVCTSNEIGIALDGTAETRVSHSIGLPDLETTDLSLGHDYMGALKLVRMFAADIGDSGLEEASS